MIVRAALMFEECFGDQPSLEIRTFTAEKAYEDAYQLIRNDNVWIKCLMIKVQMVINFCYC